MTMASMSNDNNYARLSCRVDARIKQRAEEAATILGQSITDFTELAIAEKANSVLAQHAMIMLSERDFDRFVTSIEFGAEPTPALKLAVDTYKMGTADTSNGNW